MPQLAQLIRSKYPGQYDDMTDSDLESKILAKYPEYKDLTTPESTGDIGSTHAEGGYIDSALAAAKAPGLDLPPSPNTVEPDKPIPTDLWSVANTPIWEGPAKFGKYLSEKIGESEHPYLSGFAESMGQQVAGLTSPLNIGLAGVGALAGAARTTLARGIPALKDIGEALVAARASQNGPEVARLLDELNVARTTAGRSYALGTVAKNIERGAAAGFVGKGAYDVSQGKYEEAIPELALGGLGVRNHPLYPGEDITTINPEEQDIASATHAQMYPNEPTPSPTIPPITPIDIPQETSPIGPISQQRNLDNIASSLGRVPFTHTTLPERLPVAPDFPSELPIGNQLTDASGRSIAPIEQNLPLERPPGPWDSNISPVPTELPIAQSPDIPYGEPRYAAGEFEAKPPDLPPSLDISPNEAGTPSFGIPGMRGNLKIIGKNMLVDPATGEIMKEPPSPEIPTDLPLQAVPPKSVGELVQSIPRTGDIEFDNLVSKMKALEHKFRNPGLTDPEYDEYGNLAEAVRKHPAMPPEIEARWQEIGKVNKARYLANLSKFKVGDRVQLKEPSSPERNFNIVKPDDINPEDIEPQFARSDKGGIKIGVNVKRAAEEVTSGYSAPLESIMIREGMQNAFDAVKHLGNQGQIRIGIDKDGFEITDNGKGMTRQELETVFSDINESGKVSQENATGGKGVGKASYMLGGKHFHAETVTEQNGRKIKLTIDGSPEDLMTHVDVKEEKVDPGTPTGTVIRTDFKPEHSRYNALDMLDNIMEHSRGLKSQVSVNRYSRSKNIMEKSPVDLSEVKNDRVIGEPNFDGNNIRVAIPKSANMGDRHGLTYNVLNNGMYQFKSHIYFDEETPNIPNHVNVDVNPSAKEGSPDYPFPTQRESIKESLKNQVEEYIKKVIVEPEAKSRGAKLQELYSSLTDVGNLGTKRKAMFYDPGSRLDTNERNFVDNSPTVRAFIQHFDGIADDILKRVGIPKWQDKLEGIGVVMDPGLHGVHIPNPLSPKNKSTILINPFIHMSNLNPRDAALMNIITLLHESAHIGNDTEPYKFDSKVDTSEITDPRIGKYLESYLVHLQEQGGISEGHGVGFLKRLGEVFAKYGPQKAFDAADLLEAITTDERGRYSSEVQNLLRIYKESRGRTAVTEDFLSPTGIKSEPPSGGKKYTKGANQTDAVGTSGASEPPNKSTESNKINWTGKVVNVVGPTLEQIKEGYSKGYRYVGVNPNGEVQFALRAPQGPGPVLESDVARAKSRAVRSPSNDPSSEGEDKTHWLTEALNLPRSVAASMDMSAPLRQGIGLIHRPEFWKSFNAMFKSWGSEEAFNQVQQSIADRPLFKRNVVSQGLNKPPKVMQSFAEMAGLKLTDIHGISTREEQFISHLPEKVPGFGRVFKASERAYVSYLNKLRADTFESLITQGKIFGADATVNIPLAKEIANYVNTSTGRGSLGMLEQSAVPLNNLLFAPRLIASRIQMLNPGYYIYASPFVRKQALKSLLAVAGAGNIMIQLAKAAGAKTDTDPNSADYGKIQFGNTRLDPWAGFQQYIVAAQRLLRPPQAHVGSPTRTGIAPVDLATGFLSSPGMQMKSTVTGREYDLTNPGFGRSTQFDVGLRFLRGKTTPAVGFAWSLLAGRKDLGGQPMNFTSMNPMQNSVAKLFIPMVSQDIIDVAKTNPKLLPVVAPASWFGVGVQQYGTADPRRRR